MISEEEALAKILDLVQPLPGRAFRFCKPSIVFPRPILSRVCRCRTSITRPWTVTPWSRARVGRGAICALLANSPPAKIDNCALRRVKRFAFLPARPCRPGADAVIMQEDVTRDGDEILSNVDVDPGEFVRRRGCDLSEGQKILARGARIRSTTLALLASQGLGTRRWAAKCASRLFRQATNW